MKLGLSSFTYGWAVGLRDHEPAQPMDENGLLDQVHEHGLKLLQIGDNLPFRAFTMDRLKALGARAKSEGIEIEIGARALTPQSLAMHATIAQMIGAKLIRFVVDGNDYHPSAEAIVQTIKLTLSCLNGLALGLENHDRFKASEFRQIIDAVDAPNVGVCLDTANSLGAGEGLETIVEALGPVTFNLHIKDFEVKRLPHLMGFTVTGCPAGTGLVNVPWLLKKLQEFGRCETAILEQWTTPEPELEKTISKENAWATQSLDYLKPFFT